MAASETNRVYQTVEHLFLKNESKNGNRKGHGYYINLLGKVSFGNCAVKSVGQYRLCPERKDQRFIVEMARRAEWNLFTVTP